MMRIAALNDSSSESNNEEEAGPTLEVLEADASRVYRLAISHLAKNENQQAKDALHEVLTNPYIENAGWREETERPKTLPQDIALKYSCFKNLGNIFMTEKEYEEAYKFYMKAIQLDSTEVTLWQKLGSAAIKIKDFQLAVVAFQEGLLINPNHWPCLDQLLSVMFLLGFYEDCLSLAIVTLKRDPGYIKALAFKDKIFEDQPNLIDFIKEYFKESDVLFRDVPYNKEKGDKFINTCLELRPRQKEPRPPSPTVSQTLSKELENFNWIDLTIALNETYDELFHEEPKVFVAKLKLKHLIEKYIDSKQKLALKENLKSNLTCAFKAGRRLSRSLSYNGDALAGHRNDTGGIDHADLSMGDKSCGPKRRQTIELGEGQESFRVGSRRSSSVDSESQENVDAETSKETELKKSQDQQEIVDAEVQIDLSKETEQQKMEEKVEGKLLDLTEGRKEVSCESQISKLDEAKDKRKSTISKKINAGKAQAAADQLKDIMAIKPSSEMLNNITQFDEDFYEYFDGGVYEDDEEEEDEDEEMEVDEANDQAQSGSPQESDIEIVADLSKTGNTAGPNEQSKGIKSNTAEDKAKMKSKRVLVSENEKPADVNAVEAGAKNDLQSLKEVTTPSVAQPVAPKKPKRGKRGLERELEQLDYWGRRKAKEAKRRRRTLTSKLVGDFEDNEYLTWAHLIRNFIPAALLSDEARLKKKIITISDEINKESAPPTDSEKSSQNEGSVLEDRDKKSDIAKEKGAAIKPKIDKSSFKFLENCTGSSDFILWNVEELEVGEFLHNSEQNGGVLDVMQRCQHEIIKRYKRIFPLKAAVAYIDLHQRIRNHITVGATLSTKEDPKRMFNFANTTLIYIELLMSLNSLTSQQFPDRDEPQYNLEQILGEENSLMEDDLFDIQLLLGRPDVWNEDYFQAHLRVVWIQAQIKILRGCHEEGVFHMQMVLEQMLLSQREDEAPVKIDRCRVEEDSLVLSHSHIKNELNVLQRSRILENIELKFNSGFYEEVAQILTSYFGDPKSKVHSEESCPPRHTQLLLLIESLVYLNDVKGVLKWGSMCLNDAVDNFNLNELIDDERDKWIETIKTLLLLMLDAVLEEPRDVAEAPHSDLVAMIASLVNILVIQLELGASLPQPYFSTLSPWIILHFILSQYEDAQAKKNGLPKSLTDNPHEEVDKASENDAGVSPLSSTMLLITAHDELGKNGWCCLEEGKLLLYTMDTMVAELQRSLAEDQKLVIQQAVEQIMFCLFAHPSRKTKVPLLYYKYRHLRDHGGQSIPLTFNRAVQLYKYYLPAQLPDFQSEQFPSITDDVAVLFRRILALTPDEYIHADQTKRIEDYIEGSIEASQLVPLSFPQDLKDCYYLLADNCFKGKEWDQAVHYYKFDVSINPNRIESWGPMGLARKAQLETLLNSCEVIKNTEEFFKDSRRASRCLDRVLQLDQYFCNIWVENGGLVYTIHSHASRLLTQDLNPDMSIEMFESLEKIKADMLNEAMKCFSEAFKIVEENGVDEDLPDERWLYQYMLGKLAEKKSRDPKVVLSQYIDVMKRLHNMGAKYPAKINYNTPSEFAIEALEIYFRTHVYIFKYLSQRAGKDIEASILRAFRSIVEKLSQSPFVLGKEKIINFDSKAKEPLNTEQPPYKKMKMDDSDNVFNYLLKEHLSLSYKEDKVLASNKDEKSKDGEDKDDIADKESIDIILKCIDAFELCLSRFPHHYKSLYRIAYFYHHSQTHKDNNKARNFLLGSDAPPNLSYMPCNGLFSERKISLMSPRNSNLFYGVWRIPHDEIDRAGSFAAHMYRCVSLCLDILHESKDFYTVLEIAISLRHSPDKDKKYLRDNERELLFEHATQVGIQTMKDKFRFLFKSSTSMSNSKCHLFIMEVYKAYKQMGRYLPVSESPFSKMLVEAFTIFKDLSSDNITVLREAEKYCLGNASTMMSTAVNPSVHYQSIVRTAVPPPPTIPGVARRGRPPGPSRDYGTFRFRAPQENKNTTGQSVAVQQAYKVYENLIHAQTVLHNKNLDEKSQEYYKGKHEEYKQQMLKYLQIPSVSQFFHSSLQNLGTAASKLPPPPQMGQSIVPRNKSPPSTATSKPSSAQAPQIKQSSAQESQVKQSSAPTSQIKPSCASASQVNSSSISASQIKLSSSQVKQSSTPTSQIKPSSAPASQVNSASAPAAQVKPSSSQVKPSSATISQGKPPLSLTPAPPGKQSSALVPQVKQSINSLAERSKAHGISISAVSKHIDLSSSKLAKPSMSITLSQSKPNTNSSGKLTITNLNEKTATPSNISSTLPKLGTTSQPNTNSSNKLTITNLGEKSPPKTAASNNTSSKLPKLPPGTTLSRQIDPPSGVSQHNKDSDNIKVKSFSTLTSSISSKRSITITPAKSTDTPRTKKQSNISFQAVFQASLAKPKVDIKTVSPKEPIISPTPQQLQQGIKISSLKYLKSSGDSSRNTLDKAAATFQSPTSSIARTVTTTTTASNVATKVGELKQSKSAVPTHGTDKKQSKQQNETCVITLD